MKTLLNPFKALAFVVSVTILFVTVAAAETPYRMEVFGGIGAVQRFFLCCSPETQSGVAYAGGFGVRPFPFGHPRILRMLGTEFEADALRYSNTTLGLFTGNAVFHGSIGKVEPYFLLRGGVARQSGESDRMGKVGLGAKVFLSPRISLRPDIRLMSVEYQGNFFRESISVGYHW